MYPAGAQGNRKFQRARYFGRGKPFSNTSTGGGLQSWTSKCDRFTDKEYNYSKPMTNNTKWNEWTMKSIIFYME